MPTGSVPNSGTEAATRVADVLLSFMNGSEALGVSEISRRLGLSKAVVHRILSSLASRGLVTLDGGSRTYRLGPAAAALGARALAGLELRRVALPVLRRLQRETGETTTLSELVGTARVYLDQVPSLKEIKMTVEVGRPFPLHAGASSKAILAFAPPELREQVLAGPLEALTPLTPTDRAELEAEISRIREAGTAVSRGERQRGAGSVAAPVIGVDGYAVGSISVCGPVDRFGEETVERMRPLVRDAAREISGVLGGEISRNGGRNQV
ncbi:Transcriptional regulator KdgR [Rubrobacter xylanophilus DSM 9941]|uniref:IclR family transcriptional regulator n=1 Tax=Rubrobacter xylanophilus TaxID=49319 RepID=UPI001C6413FA|nr:IclR family transcriptional regulator [Rubrobacter xylanophilus]QYJ16589.1 Transcriptional regulator KdgR [Rubrobacter xylanophilus DSM 9941]